MKIRNGNNVRDMRLNRLVQFDERSRSFPIVQSEAERVKRPRSYTWRLDVPYVIDQKFDGSCFPKDTLIEMGDGSHKPIQDIKTLDKVRSAEGNEQTVLQTMVRWKDNGLINLKLRGHSHLKATPEHPILTKRGYIPIKDLVIGDYVKLPYYTKGDIESISPKEYIGFNKRNYSKAGKRIINGIKGQIDTSVNIVPNEIKLTKNFGKIVGLWLAEGSTSCGKVIWSLGQHEKDTIATELMNMLKTELGIDAGLQTRGNGHIKVNVYGKQWALLFENLFSIAAYEKRVPSELMRGPKEFLDGVLTGWLDGDGHFRRGRCCGVTVSHDLAMSMYRIAQVLGKAPTIRFRPPCMNKHAATRRWRWDLEFSDSDGCQAELDKNCVWRKVNSIEYEDWEGYVYNIHVENDESYIAEGVGVHNCVGFSITNELMARPAEVRFGDKRQTEQFAKEQIYWEAQRIDPWSGGSYPGANPHYEGTSVLAGVKVAHKLGYFDEYRWSFGLQDLIYGLGHNGPAVIGVNWYTDMFITNYKGFVAPTGFFAGGHALLAYAVKLKWKSHKFIWWNRTWNDVDLDASYISLRNSWGPYWGKGGDCYMSLRDIGVLLAQQGEAVFMVKRTTKV